jgi:FAD/FMN-containing dehydrogenase
VIETHTIMMMLGKMLWTVLTLFSVIAAGSPVLLRQPAVPPIRSDTSTGDMERKVHMRRCVPPALCWHMVPWFLLNHSVNGRLQKLVNPFEACLGDAVVSTACNQTLQNSTQELWVTAHPGGYLHTGQYGAWNVSRAYSYAVAARTTRDMQQTVLFARKHNLHLVVKNTGHDWLGRSNAPGSLMLWTHQRKRMDFHEAFVPEGCDEGSTSVPAVTLESGVQFADLYPAAQARGVLVIGGTCDSVGVAGCYLGGCYGTFSKKFGSAASNLLQAKVVLANGQLVTANRCTNPDLFYALRGGGGGFGVVTEFTTRTHRAPRTVLMGGFSGKAWTETGFRRLLAVALNVSVATAQGEWGGALAFGRAREEGGYTVSLGLKGYELPQQDGERLVAPLRALAEAQPPGSAIHSCSSQWTIWNGSNHSSESTFPWMEVHPDREIGTELLGTLNS